MLQLMAFWIVIVPLPLAFIVPMRGDAPLYLLLFGWAMIFAKIAFDLITLISKFSVFIAGRVLTTAKREMVRNASGDEYLRVFQVMATLLIRLLSQPLRSARISALACLGSTWVQKHPMLSRRFVP